VRQKGAVKYPFFQAGSVRRNPACSVQFQTRGAKGKRGRNTARDAAAHMALNDRRMSFKIMDAYCNDRRMAARMPDLHHMPL